MEETKDTKINNETNTEPKSKKKLPLGVRIVSAVGSTLVIIATIIGAVLGS